MGYHSPPPLAPINNDPSQRYAHAKTKRKKTPSQRLLFFATSDKDIIAQLNLFVTIKIRPNKKGRKRGGNSERFKFLFFSGNYPSVRPTFSSPSPSSPPMSTDPGLVLLPKLLPERPETNFGSTSLGGDGDRTTVTSSVTSSSSRSSSAAARRTRLSRKRTRPVLKWSKEERSLRGK